MSAVIEARGLVHQVSGGITLLHGVELNVRPGAITGVLGPNGAGKSTLLRMVIGDLPLRQGSLRLGGTDIKTLSRRERAQVVAFVAQDSPADVSMDVLDVVLLGRTPHLGRFAAKSDDDLDLAMDCLRRTGAQHLATRDIATLSGGERQRVHLARALAQQPAVLILDEPTNHLDVAAQLGVVELIGELAATGTGVLMAMHDLGQAATVCDEVVVLHDGRVVAAGPTDEVLTAELIARVWGVAAEWVQGTTGRALVLTRGHRVP